jgi:hypothetical protein
MKESTSVDEDALKGDVIIFIKLVFGAIFPVTLASNFTQCNNLSA